jgi:hypothetical protein
MKHYYKTGRPIIDKDIKFVKRLLKKKPIKFDAVYWFPQDIQLKITNIRKYQHRYGGSFVYEVDVKVMPKRDRWYYHHSVRSKNSRIRKYSNEKLLREELEFFNINDVTISKIEYV